MRGQGYTPLVARPLFQTGRFRLRSGRETAWRINADMLDDHSLSTLAQRTRHFGAVEGVPRGGLALPEVLQAYIEPLHPTLLIVDDVLTTGAAMVAFRGDRLAIGYVLFDRSFGARPGWIGALWSLSSGREQ